MNIYRTSANIIVQGKSIKVHRALPALTSLAATREMRRIAEKLILNNKFPGLVTDISAKKIT